jgi:phosphatidate cytidylyltransferase
MGCAPEVTETKPSQQEGAAAPRPWRDLALRGASAVVLIPLALFGIWSGGVVWDVLIGAAMVLLSWEWLRLCGASVYRWPGILLPFICLGVMLLAAFGPPLGALGLLVAGTLLLLLLQRQGDIWPAAALFYIGLCGFSLILLRGADWAGLLNTLFMVLIVWASDTGAYLAGRAFGGPKLAPAISPGKTWSGAAGGLVAAILVGAGAAAHGNDLRRTAAPMLPSNATEEQGGKRRCCNGRGLVGTNLEAPWPKEPRAAPHDGAGLLNDCIIVGALLCACYDFVLCGFLAVCCCFGHCWLRFEACTVLAWC